MHRTNLVSPDRAPSGVYVYEYLFSYVCGNSSPLLYV